MQERCPPSESFGQELTQWGLWVIQPEELMDLSVPLLTNLPCGQEPMYKR